MGFSNQLEKLRLIVSRVLDEEEFTQKDLADAVGVTQPIISNFVSGKRRIGWDTADGLKAFLKVSDRELLDETAGTKATVPETVPVVRQKTARSVPHITPDLILRSSGVTLHSLPRLSASATLERLAWTRFVAIEVTRGQARFLEPLVPEAALLIIDRHAQKQLPDTAVDRALYVLEDGPHLSIGYLQIAGHAFVLHAYRAVPRVFPLDSPARLATLIVGRVCKVLSNR